MGIATKLDKPSRTKETICHSLEALMIRFKGSTDCENGGVNEMQKSNVLEDA
jgi:hypothetical protein